MLQVAVDKQKIVANPCDRVETPKVPTKEMVFLGWDEVVALADAHNERFRTLILFAVETGMRWSELVGLRRSKVDLRAGRVRVTEQLVRLGAGEWLRKDPKTPASIRSISLSPALVELLEEHLRHHAAEGPDALVFPSSRRTPLISSSFLTHHFGPARQAAGLACRFHDLRHTSVALAIASGADPKAIQTRMGHSPIRVTLDRYGHLLPELDQAIAASFGNELRRAETGAPARSCAATSAPQPDWPALAVRSGSPRPRPGRRTPHPCGRRSVGRADRRGWRPRRSRPSRG